MKKIALLVAMLLVAAAASAQTTTPGRIEAHDIATSIASGQIDIAMRIDATRAEVHRREAIVLRPVILKGDRRKELATIVVSGPNRMRADARALRFKRSLPYNAAAAVAPGVIPYAASTAWEPWMGGAKLVLEERTFGCNRRHLDYGRVELASLRPAEPVKPLVRPAVIYITPPAEAVKNRAESGEAYLEFQSGRSAILADFRNNFAELSKIRNMIDALRGNSAVTMGTIALRGFASPEGSSATNTRLSQARAEALRGYIQREYGLPATSFDVSSGGEDWEGFKKRIERSALSNKDAILSIIGSAASHDIKEQQLKGLSNYAELLAVYFPQLRRVDYRLDYTVRAFSVDEGRTVIRTHPGQMSLNEMFLVAQSYPEGSPDFKQVFDVAVRNFPTDPVANLNQGASLLESGDVEGAARYITPYAAQASAWNNLGVLQMLQGDYAGARDSFGKAGGGAEVSRNLALLAQLEAYAMAKAEFDAY